jgi:purine-nucleoside phosphorylase
MISDDLAESVAYIRTHCPAKPRIALILGSGMGSFAESIKLKWSSDYRDIPHFGTTSVEGHRGRLIIGEVGGVEIAALQGRLHLYEGYDVAQVVYPTRTLALLGAEVLIVTNASGGLRKKMKPGDFMIIRDHINLMGENPLRGKNFEQLGPRFPDMTEAYDKKFVKFATDAAKKNKLRHSDGVYAGVPGPTYETPAEVRYLQTIGADAVGMSTVPEAIAARHLGMRVAGISVITNMAAGIEQKTLDHSEVTETAARVMNQLSDLILESLPAIAQYSASSLPKGNTLKR